MFAPGHLGELTQVVDFALVDAVLTETRAVQRRVRLLPARVVVYFVLALALFEDCGYRAVWDELTAGLAGVPLVRPHTSSLSRARRRLAAAPLRALFEALAGAVAWRGGPGADWRGMRTVAFDGTGLHCPTVSRSPPASPSGARAARVRLPAAPVRHAGRDRRPRDTGRRVRARG
ncbi:transposase domain-containing protein [Streptomyces sp. A1-5]|uniref:transposase domain-containing protein n=1 Tax=Streptomyces sp. A1-5 TaxID=2738410 RepID=UPI003FA7A2C6|nr:transposase domain-containing protein [Streptomyces sp. A1-5]